MNSKTSPSFRNVRARHSLSPLEIKEKIRQNCKEKLKNRRLSFVNSLRGINEEEIKDTIDEVYRELFGFTDADISHEEELDFISKVKDELIEEEYNWFVEEYERSQINYDLESLDREDLICPVCQKTYLIFGDKNVSCATCKWKIDTDKTINEIKNHLNNTLENHSKTCNCVVTFAEFTDTQTHIFLMCNGCRELACVI